ncbi:FxLYD domain-containing protein [Streptomyces sp. NPDC056190]|uniref:FxLYD domain-containing protein n=1 Tax=unclassified Streptomyces TaxID=2593676 RepID=UPI0035D6D51F
MVTNHSSKASNYIIEVEITDGSGTRKGEGTAALNNLAPGQKAEVFSRRRPW